MRAGPPIHATAVGASHPFCHQNKPTTDTQQKNEWIGLFFYEFFFHILGAGITGYHSLANNQEEKMAGEKLS